MRKFKILKKAAALVVTLIIAFPLVSPLSDAISNMLKSGTTASAAGKTLSVTDLWNDKKASLTDSSGNAWFSGDTFQHWADTSTTDVVWVNAEKISSTNGSYGVKYHRIESLSTTTSGTVSDYAYSTSQATPDAYYTVTKTRDADGNKIMYPTYYISTAKQLKQVLQEKPEYLWTDSGKTDDEYVGQKKIAIKLLCDIDLGGKGGTAWALNNNKGGNWQSYIYELDGNGYTIYNGYFQGVQNSQQKYTDFFINVSGKNYKGLSIRNVTFSNMYMNRSNGLFGNYVEHMYLYNCNFTDCYATSGACTTIMLGNEYNHCLIKECTVKDSYIYSTSSSGHGGLFGSYNGAESGNYITEIPSSLSEIEAIWSGSNCDNYPTIFEDCQTIDSECYFDGTSSRHQGVFVSCTQGGEIFRRCFSNCMAYGNQQVGVFLGACIGSANGFKMDADGDGDEELVNTYFEDCFTSGVIEGNQQIGGFVGMIYDDDRADGDNGSGKSSRGVCYFKNCYSTSSVGMQYSGSYIGGFVGYVRGNLEASDGVQTHYFINCYAAGEVGGIATETANTLDDGTSNTGTIGGFVGTYDDGYAYNNNSKTSHTIIPIVATNCYYDKQTTAMRERAVGGTDLWNTIEGLTGVYTTKSDSKGVAGLTDSNVFGTGNGYDYVTEYYPQITSILYPAAAYYDDFEEENEAITTMFTNRTYVKMFYSLASAATVFLDHYDQTLSEKQSASSKEIYIYAAATTYDTVRDITSIFTFTSTLESDAYSTVVWKKNDKLNKDDEFTEYFGGTTTVDDTTTPNGFQLSYDYTNSENEKTTYEKNFYPEVLDMTYTESKYQCISFAPGKQWVQVSIGKGNTGKNDTENEIKDTTIVGKRSIRLLPTAYIDAGDTVTITIGKDSDNKTTYEVMLKDIIYDNSSLDMSMFNHAIGVAYAISDKDRMVDCYSDSDQIITEYSGAEDKKSFALSGKYRVYDGDSVMDSTINGVFNEQFFSKTGLNNASDVSGMTMVKVWKAAQDDNNVLQDSKPVSVTEGSINYDKWSGTEQFTQDDTGYYYLHYYWRLDDGRYLSDIKLVEIKTTSAYIEMRTGVLESSLPAGTTNIIDLTDIDQYVNTKASETVITDEDKETWDVKDDTLYWYKKYPTKDSEYSSTEDKTTYYTGTNNENNELTLYNDSEFTYSVKSIRNITDSTSNVVGWYNTSDYKMTTLILEVSDGTEWKEMTRVDLELGSNFDEAIYDLNAAEYSATFAISQVSQDKKTRKYTVSYVNGGNQTVSFTVQTFKVNTLEADYEHKVRTTSEDKEVAEERYIVLSVTNTYDDSVDSDTKNTTTTSLKNPIRVTALYQKAEATVTPQKEVLAAYETLDSPDTVYTVENYDKYITDKSGSEVGYYADSLKGLDDSRSMDNYVDGEDEDETLEKSDSESHAVLEGDTLTYRVRLKNTGYNSATDLVLTDIIPEGCTYVESSAKVYSQLVNFSSNVIKYSNVDYEKDITPTYDNVSGELTVNFGDDVKDFDFRKEYYIYFQVTVNHLNANEAKFEIENTAKIVYQDDNSGTNKEESSNKVSTDQTHIYAEIEKTISKADIGRSFLYKIERYKSQEDAELEGASPTDTYYVELCFDESIEADENGNYVAKKLLQTDKDGYYIITEIDDWSNTDYQRYSGTEDETATHEFKLRGDGLLYRLTFYTENCKTSDFTNTLDKYAYSDSQAYVDNKIQSDE